MTEAAALDQRNEIRRREHCSESTMIESSIPSCEALTALAVEDEGWLSTVLLRRHCVAITLKAGIASRLCLPTKAETAFWT